MLNRFYVSIGDEKMTIVGSNFTKINIERFKALKGKVNINNNISITDINEADLSIGSDSEKGMKFNFEYVCDYQPEIGKINLTGEIFLIEKKELTESIIKSWNEKKQIPSDYMTSILNAVLTKCNVQALIMSQTMNLPPPIPMPKVSGNSGAKSDNKAENKSESKESDDSAKKSDKK